MTAPARATDDWLNDIRVMAEKIIGYTEGLTREAFLDDELVHTFVTKNLENMGEAVKQLPEELRIANNDIPWSKLSRLRDRTTHGYFSVDYDIIWSTARENVPELLRRVENLIERRRQANFAVHQAAKRAKGGD